MTAIAGVVHWDGRPIARATAERMLKLLQPMGRDTQAHWLRGSVLLMRSLCRITPEDVHDRQPLYDAAAELAVVFDGRLDNREELAAKLGMAAADAAQMADSELVWRACLRWDSAAPAHLLGDYALACWQGRTRRLWLARDAMGARPLFWYRRAALFAFATMPKALFAIPGVPRALDEERLADFLALLPLRGSRSWFQDVQRVEPGQCVIVDDGRLSLQQHFHLDAVRTLRLRSDAEYVEAFGEQLERAVACRLRSSGAIATHLSSGFDSSTVTAVAARQLGLRGQRLQAYTAVPRSDFPGVVERGRYGDEGPGARAVAARFTNIDHHLIATGETSPLDGLDTDIEAAEFAPLNLCNKVWSDAILADAARRDVKVLLIGQRGNMTISYDGLSLLPTLIRRGHWRRWWQEASAYKRSHAQWRWRGILASSLGPYIPAPLWAALNTLRGRRQQLGDYSPIHPAFAARIDIAGRARAAQWDLSYRPWAHGRALRIAVLRRTDNAAAFAASNLLGIETRDPTNDRRLVEFCLAVPDEQYLRLGVDRWLLRRLMGGILPAQILDVRGKGLQAADWYLGMRKALPEIREQLERLRMHHRAGQYLDLEALSRAVAEWPDDDAGWARTSAVYTYRLKLLRGLSAGAFIRYAEQANSD